MQKYIVDRDIKSVIAGKVKSLTLKKLKEIKIKKIKYTIRLNGRPILEYMLRARRIKLVNTC